MCKKRNHKSLQIDGRRVKVDDCLSHIVALINSSINHKTLGCCCGHNRYKQTIIVTDKSGVIWEAFSGKRIDRKRKFYKLDDQGYYYVPEIDKPKRSRIK